jgi:hypothetical protein
MPPVYEMSAVCAEQEQAKPCGVLCENRQHLHGKQAASPVCYVCMLAAEDSTWCAQHEATQVTSIAERCWLQG